MKLSRFRFYCGLIDPQGNEVREAQYLAQVFACEYVKGFTLTRATGYWEGASESSIVIEILCEDWELNAPKLAECLREVGNQDAVLWTHETMIDAHLTVR